MTTNSLDPKAALLGVDLQKAILGLPAVHPIDGIVNKAVALAEAFRGRKLSVVLVSADGTAPGRAERARALSVFPPGWIDLLPELNRQPTDHAVTKRT